MGNPSSRAAGWRTICSRTPRKNQVYVKNRPEPGAKTAVTEYRLIKTSGALSLMECRLLTGRTHQIRAQMAHAGMPLLGDE